MAGVTVSTTTPRQDLKVAALGLAVQLHGRLVGGKIDANTRTVVKVTADEFLAWLEEP